MPDYQFTRFPIPGKEVDFEAIQNEITTLQESASALQEQLDALTESTVPETRTINGLDLTEDRVLKSAQFAESVTGEKMMANLLYSQVSSWDSGAKKSIKMESDIYLSSDGITHKDTGRPLTNSGTWTPVIPRATITSVISATWTRAGNIVHANAILETGSVPSGTTGSQNVYISEASFPKDGLSFSDGSIVSGSWENSTRRVGGSITSSDSTSNRNAWIYGADNSHRTADYFANSRVVIHLVYSVT